MEFWRTLQVYLRAVWKNSAALWGGFFVSIATSALDRWGHWGWWTHPGAMFYLVVLSVGLSIAQFLAWREQYRSEIAPKIDPRLKQLSERSGYRDPVPPHQVKANLMRGGMSFDRPAEPGAYFLEFDLEALATICDPTIEIECDNSVQEGLCHTPDFVKRWGLEDILRTRGLFKLSGTTLQKGERITCEIESGISAIKLRKVSITLPVAL